MRTFKIEEAKREWRQTRQKEDEVYLPKAVCQEKDGETEYAACEIQWQ